MEEPPQDGSANGRSRRPRAHSHDGGDESAVGRSSDSRGIAEAWLHDGTNNRREIHGPPPPPRPSPTWRTFVATDAQQLVAADFFVVPTATYRLLFVLVLLAHDRRRIVHVAVTDHPTAAWTVQQFREAFPWDFAPRYLLRDRDHAFDSVTTLGIHGGTDRTAFPLAERLCRTIHRIGPARLPRSRHRADRCRPSSRPGRVRRLLLANPNAPRPEQGCTSPTSDHAADKWTGDGDSPGRWFAPSLRAARRVASFVLLPLYAIACSARVRHPSLTWIPQST